MELDELKIGWKRSAEKIQTPATDVYSLINNKHTGPLNELKHRFRKGMILVTVIIAIALSRLPHHHGIAFTMFFSFLMFFGISMIAYFYYNYQLLSRAQAMNVTVKEHLQKQVRILENGVRFRLIFMRAMAIVFIVLIEVLLYWGKDMGKWQSQNVTTRLAVYAGVFAAFYLLTHMAVKKRYGQHITNLKQLVSEIE